MLHHPVQPAGGKSILLERDRRSVYGSSRNDFFCHCHVGRRVCNGAQRGIGSKKKRVWHSPYPFLLFILLQAVLFSMNFLRKKLFFDHLFGFINADCISKKQILATSACVCRNFCPRRKNRTSLRAGAGRTWTLLSSHKDAYCPMDAKTAFPCRKDRGRSRIR